MMDISQEEPTSPIDYDDDMDTSSVYIKRPPEDEEPSDDDMGPPMTQALGSTANSLLHEVAPPSTALSETTTTEPQLPEESAQDPMALIQEMQASYAQQLAELRDQQATLTSELDQLKSLLNSHLNSQISAINLLQSVSYHHVPPHALSPPSNAALLQNIAAIPAAAPAPKLVSRPPILPAPTSSSTPKTFVPPYPVSSHRTNQSSATATLPLSSPAPDRAYATPTPQRELPSSTLSAMAPSPAQFGSSAKPAPNPLATSELKIIPSAVPNEPPTVVASHIDTVSEAWEEYRYGRAGNMSVEKLDAQWGPRWRQEAKLRTWYQRRKLIADRIKVYMADGISEKDAVMEVEKMRRGRSLNWVSRILGEDAKETRKQRKVAAQAATAARQALHGLPSGPSF